MNQFYYIDANGQQRGPVEISAVKISGIVITPETMVWHSGIPNWVPAKNVPELLCVIQQPSCPPQSPVNPQPSYTPPVNSGVPYQNNGAQYQNNCNANQCPQSWLWLGICATILCCLPLGIVSIVYASKVDSSWNRGDYQGAIDNSNKAKMWGLISVGCGVLFSIFYIILLFAA